MSGYTAQALYDTLFKQHEREHYAAQAAARCALPWLILAGFNWFALMVIVAIWEPPWWFVAPLCAIVGITVGAKLRDFTTALGVMKASLKERHRLNRAAKEWNEFVSVIEGATLLPPIEPDRD